MKKTVHSEGAPSPIGPYSQAVAIDGLVFLSGQIAIDPATGQLNNSDLSTETHQVMKNIGAVLEEVRSAYSDIVKTTIFLSDMVLFNEVNAVYGSYFTGDFPARETVAVKGLPMGVNVEISAVALRRL